MESVWDYPRPPRLEPCEKAVEVFLGGERIASSDRALRVLETSHPPVIYIPAQDFVDGALSASAARPTFCEFKGVAEYFDVGGGGQTEKAAAWHYPEPVRAFEELRGHVAVYPGRMERCTLGGEEVQAQEGDFYGGWITSDIEGPFKGGPGTRGW
ncbi:MAG: DUF427 domain-containing protein [Acidobacteria bacterium]|nr:DUF427 domain-containing protein [Acidobacteriota bacterium]